MLKVIVIRSNACSPDVRVARLISFFCAQNFQATLLCWDRGMSYPSTEQTGSGSVYRIRIAAKYGSGIKLFPKLLCFWWQISKYLIIHRKEIDVIHSCDLDTYLPALCIAKLTRKKIIYDIFDYYSQGGNIPILFKNILKQIEIKIVPMSDHVILVDENRIAYFPSKIIKYLNLKHKLSIVYNTPEDIYDHVSKHSISQNDKLTLVYAGSFNGKRHIKELIIACGEVPDKFDLILAGNGEADYIQYLRTEILPLYKNCKYLGILSPQDTLKVESQSDIVVSFYDISVAQNRTASPNKFFEALMLGKPFMTNKGNNIDRIVSKNEVGFIVSIPTVNQIKVELTYIWNHKDELKTKSDQARQLYLKRYSYTKNVNKLKSIYQTLSV